LIVAIAGFVAAAGIAIAHPLPKSANPKPNEALTASPSEIRIGFSEGLVAAFSGMELDDDTGKAVSTNTATIDPNDSKELILPLSSRLAPGTYTVKWHAVGDDTHHVAGHYSFQVK
jgi:copper resistance protein C